MDNLKLFYKFEVVYVREDLLELLTNELRFIFNTN
ncbi:hypothetical protein SAMN05444285_14817 [Draconibacterium orientale]|jgi:hypothetical protein|uniref:Uncharacterized protein n=1 Tax=Draconibacterium orientale TaxID=1168034 RepID=A0A1I0JME5_9BACT|nr:hypothetical protein SAMN05444285_14817 [Draconibacterium orientale]